MSASYSPEGLRPPAFLSTSEGIQLVHLLHPETTGGTVVQLIAVRDGEGTSSLARDLCLVAARDVGLRTILLDLDGNGRAQVEWVRRTHDVPLALAGSISVRPCSLTILKLGASHFHVGEPYGDMPVPATAWPGIFNLLRPRFDFIVVDSPAFARSFDGVLAAPHVDGTLLVIEAQATRAAHVQTLRDRIVEIGGKIVGSVLNKGQFQTEDAVYERV